MGLTVSFSGTYSTLIMGSLDKLEIMKNLKFRNNKRDCICIVINVNTYPNKLDLNNL